MALMACHRERAHVRSFFLPGGSGAVGETQIQLRDRLMRHNHLQSQINTALPSNTISSRRSRNPSTALNILPIRSRLAWFLQSHRIICKSAKMAELMENEVVRAFSTYAVIVVVKMLLMGPMTGYYRFTRGSFSNEEDVARKSAEQKKHLLKTHPDVERVRRCHQNDLENIIPFVIVGLLYALTGPELSVALLHFRIFAGARIFHTIAYIGALPQPSRGLSWVLGMLVTFSMAYRVLNTVLFL